MRVSELAKELNMTNKDLIERIQKMGILVKNHMSTLTEAAVQKVRQQFAEARAETVEQKRIGRAVIRRRKRVSEEEGISEEAVAALPETVVSPSVESTVTESVAEQTIAAETPIPEIPPPVSERAETPPEVVEETPAAPSPPPEGPQPEPPVTPTLKHLEVEAAVPEPEPSPPAAEPSALQEPPVSQEPSLVIESTAVTEPAVEPAAVVDLAPPPSPLAEQPPGVAEEPAAAGEESEEEGTGAARKSKKRRRKKVKKDEPARIIKLPEIIIPEEPEAEPEVDVASLAPRLQVKAVVEEKEVKEAVRKKAKVRPEEAAREREALARQKTSGRKEVVGREALYSKKELEAQADRGRSRGGKGAARGDFRPEPAPAAPKVGKKRIKIDEAITVANLAKFMGVKAGEVIKKLLLLGIPATINQALDFDTAALLAAEFEFEVEKIGFEEEEILQTQEDRSEDLHLRPPVITVMGHVDHGKTSLLDAIRHTNVIGGEAGGITQHIGAYYVKLEKGDVVFLDTPGHEAFTSMRARGAKVTDIVILLVAADDGVMQQTVEAINHAKAANVPIIVAINKIDKPNANVERVRRQLADQGLMPEEWGGNTTMVEISAKKRQGIEDLLEMVLLQAELMEIKSNPAKPARGRVIESKLDKGRGPVATILIQEGTLRAGDVYVCGANAGRVRNMFNDRGKRLEQAGPSVPVEVLGFSTVPNAGDQFIVLSDEKQARLVAEHRLLKQREKELVRTSKVTLESLFEKIQEGEIKELNVILKTDVHGSQEAINDSLLKLSTPEVKVNLIHSGTGAITETDVMLAAASNAIVIGFNVRADSKVQELADNEHVNIRYYDVIYQVLSDVRDAMVGMLEPVFQESVMGHAEVRQTFHVPKVGMIAGCSVTDGRVERNAKVRVVRDGIVVYDGKLNSLKRFKDDVKEVKAGFECGMGIENFNDVKVGDIFEIYELKEVKATLTINEDDR